MRQIPQERASRQRRLIGELRSLPNVSHHHYSDDAQFTHDDFYDLAHLNPDSTAMLGEDQEKTRRRLREDQEM